MFVSPFNRNVSYVFVREDSSLELSLHSDEVAILSKIGSEFRKIEFRLGRIAARVALEGLGVTWPSPILRGKNREPLWPSGVVGSITHARLSDQDIGQAETIAIAICAWKREVRGLGIDLQQIHHTPALDISRKIAVGNELNWIGSGLESGKKMLILFSAKESVYKTLYPLTKQWLGFHDVELEWSDREHRFRGKLLKDLGNGFTLGYSFTVGVRNQDQCILTYMSVT